ncbi:DNA repair protein RecN [Motiliproteus sediminis]|uniref:DNA repair protein RecN n=1 Tax=Motiliproteus sediminis TaxID=1468178 RepID=UPI001AEF8A18|nr:DNA repair protein RecN [Motiliproteus sediminis]
MLTHLSIRDFTLIDQLELELDTGMTVISGETGAGKSIMLDALGLALGDRADSDMIRQGCDRADISASFDLSTLQGARLWLQEHALDQSDDCILRRVISRNGRSRAFINGQPSPLQHLRELGELLIEIHGQHEHQRLLKRDNHGPLLDAYAGLDNDANELREHFRHWRGLTKQLAQVQQNADDQSARIQLLSYQVEELDQLSPTEGELQQLETEQRELANAGELLQSGEGVRQWITEGEEGSCASLLNQSLHCLADLQIDSAELNNVNELLSSALIQVEEASAELARYLDRIELDPQRLQEVDERLSLLLQVARKHRVAPEELPALHQSLADELDSLEQPEAAIEALNAEADAAEQQYRQLADQLTTRRRDAAAALNQQINDQLTELGMSNARFETRLNERDPGPGGLEEIEFLISTNPGNPPKALAKIASGGELSRISLAIQVVTAKTSATPVLAFDEVDVGIGGAIAEVVGRLLCQLGERCQVLCVTHQPQVAARGHHHLYVSKQSANNDSYSRVEALDQQARVQEVARMLGGIEITQRSLDHAEEMLALR